MKEDWLLACVLMWENSYGTCALWDTCLNVIPLLCSEKLVSYPNEKEDKEAEYLHRLGRWAEASQANKRLLTRKWVDVQAVKT